MGDFVLFRDERHGRTKLLRALLQWKRSQLTREAAGLPARRGSRGALTQDDLAELTGYSARVVGQLESGRLRSPTPDLLDAVSRGLRLTPDERRILWTLAAGTVPPSRTYTTGPDAGLARLVEHVYPHPAYVTDAAWNVQSANPGIAEWFCDFSKMPAEDRNVAKWFFCHPHAKHAFVDWEADGAQFLARIRAIAAKFPDDPRLATLIDELRRTSSYVDDLWQSEGGVYVDPATATWMVRRPGHTDPAQPDDTDHHVPIDVVSLAPMRANDERRAVFFLLPDDEPNPPAIPSADTCTACARQTGR